ncbi:23S rRNA (uracil(1939)-C(5))-methyltransferase RlmD [Waterburya agarophytonicola K14]|uniref:23S rRNA (Uracil(1939)-C(5))-methyltransferase RlmD n=1 Tax=Waterburya agarophytonicola KI4 TaxID=2874699 RepID=A0A964BSB9_9CYAN|nr:23S rRNA (uracil(1939)-C(5))-methyltransferase RlmD [Waterburya agarophytonicola]MCC0177638.1 23S rRNA (uracil(1939)-C(5))-methyltransferase RlmD [Waterburya agarophytonicola KI4]
MKQKLEQGQTVELEIIDLNTSGDGVGRHEGRVVFVPNTVTGDRINAKIIQSKAKFARGKVEQLLTPSPYRIRPQCIVADKCGGCQWQHIEPDYQRKAKRQQVIQAFERIGGFADIKVQPILHTPDVLNYRNKSTYPLGRSATGQVQAGYYRQSSHKLVNLNQCPVQDERLHPLLKEVKQDIQQRGWSIYDESNHRGKLRHLSLRIGSHTGEMLLTLVTTSEKLAGIEEQAQLWLDKYPELVGVCLNLNPNRTNAILGEITYTVAGKPYLREKFAGVKLHIAADTFFQVNTNAAELLLSAIVEQLNLTGNESIIDAYCGIGTFSLPLAKKVKQVAGIEINPTSIKQAQNNAALNNITNTSFYTGKVKDCIELISFKPDILLLDPPRKGCAPQVIETVLKIQPSCIVYISCKPATLARDIKLICQSNTYQSQYIQPTDFFPQTTHVETYVILRKC